VVIVVCGVAGSGKTTIGTLLAKRLEAPYADADEFHPESNRRKMAAGVPLTDVDRLPWLEAIAAWIDQRIAAGETGVTSCSALKLAYRDVLREGRPQVRLVFLDVRLDEIERRLANRHGHFFPPRLAQSQFEALDAPRADEPQVIVVDGNPPPDQVVDAILAST
jgi:gluconokinase